uniref:Uncharacterized protein n=1 Tax=Octopus bimaculoides TaxID=37653 RepID=A0A0L8HX66_OCTBM
MATAHGGDNELKLSAATAEICYRTKQLSAICRQCGIIYHISPGQRKKIINPLILFKFLIHKSIINDFLFSSQIILLFICNILKKLLQTPFSFYIKIRQSSKCRS